MTLPIVIASDLEKSLLERWQLFYDNASDRNRKLEEGIWRRTQRFENAVDSGWASSKDQRRRIVHYRHEYGINTTSNNPSINLENSYIYYSLSLPLDEYEQELAKVYAALERGKWIPKLSPTSPKSKFVWERGNLTCTLSCFEFHPEDERANRKLPSNYRTFDVTIFSKLPTEAQSLPWDVLAKGMRQKDTRGNPEIISDFGEIEPYLPFHLEIGCGVSLEAGVPALHHLHDLYCVTDRESEQFIFGGPKDQLLESLLCDPETQYIAFAKLFKSSFLAEPTIAHKALLALKGAGHMVGPVLTNNFDGLTHRVGLTEQFLRRYDESIPHVEFDPTARSLLVIGSHADRRRVQSRARTQGLKVFYIDPEGYWDGERFINYPLEGPLDQDVLFRTTASAGLVKLCSHLGIRL